MIHQTAIVSVKASIGDNVEIGPYSIIHDHVVLKPGSHIGAYCEIGVKTPLASSPELHIGENSIIRSHTVIYAGSSIGADFITGHYVCVRENSLLGEGVQIGSRGDIQGDCSIGDYTKMHADVHIGKNSKVGSYAWLFPEVLLTNDPMPPSEISIGPEIGDFCVLASKVLVLPGVKIHKEAVIGVGSIVKTDIEAGKLAQGIPAKAMCNASILRMPSNPRQKAYPWRDRFHRGYPTQLVESWINDALSKD